MAHPGIAIRAMRKALGLSLKRLSELAGKDSPDYLAQVERGKRMPSDRWLLDVEKALVARMGEKETA